MPAWGEATQPPGAGKVARAARTAAANCERRASTSWAQAREAGCDFGIVPAEQAGGVPQADLGGGHSQRVDDLVLILERAVKAAGSGAGMCWYLSSYQRGLLTNLT